VIRSWRLGSFFHFSFVFFAVSYCNSRIIFELVSVADIVITWARSSESCCAESFGVTHYCRWTSLQQACFLVRIGARWLCTQYSRLLVPSLSLSNSSCWGPYQNGSWLWSIKVGSWWFGSDVKLLLTFGESQRSWERDTWNDSWTLLVLVWVYHFVVTWSRCASNLRDLPWSCTDWSLSRWKDDFDAWCISDIPNGVILLRPWSILLSKSISLRLANDASWPVSFSGCASWLCHQSMVVVSIWRRTKNVFWNELSLLISNGGTWLSFKEVVCVSVVWAWSCECASRWSWSVHSKFNSNGLVSASDLFCSQIKLSGTWADVLCNFSTIQAIKLGFWLDHVFWSIRKHWFKVICSWSWTKWRQLLGRNWCFCCGQSWFVLMAFCNRASQFWTTFFRDDFATSKVGRRIGSCRVLVGCLNCGVVLGSLNLQTTYSVFKSWFKWHIWIISLSVCAWSANYWSYRSLSKSGTRWLVCLDYVDGVGSSAACFCSDMNRIFIVAILIGESPLGLEL